jgi:hypothetical protein
LEKGLGKTFLPKRFSPNSTINNGCPDESQADFYAADMLYQTMM